jgi:hypothetical protein
MAKNSDVTGNNRLRLTGWQSVALASVVIFAATTITVVALLIGSGGTSSAETTTTNLGLGNNLAVVSGTTVPCVGFTRLNDPLWRGVVMLTQEGRFFQQQVVDANHRDFRFIASPGNYQLTATGTTAGNIPAHLSSKRELFVTLGAHCK